MKDLEFISQAVDGDYLGRAQELKNVKESGDSLTDFVATKEDLKSLAHALVAKLSDDDFLLRMCRGEERFELVDNILFRLGRVVAYLPELKPEIEEELRHFHLKNEEWIRKWNAEVARARRAEGNKAAGEAADRQTIQ